MSLASGVLALSLAGLVFLVAFVGLWWLAGAGWRQ